MSDTDEAFAEVTEPEIFNKCFRFGGQIYSGQCKEGPEGTFLRHGIGKQLHTAHTIEDNVIITGRYEGEWYEDVIQGEGSYWWPDGSSYTGTFQAGELHGSGRFEWPEGSSYEGVWSHGEPSGKGRFDNKFDGSYLIGNFHRNSFQRMDGKWVNICCLHRDHECRATLEGDVSVVRIKHCSSQEELKAILDSIHEEGLLPFVLAGEGGPASPLDWLENTSVVRIREVAVEQSRCSDFRRFFYNAIQTALLKNSFLSLMFEDGDQESGMPEEWQLSRFYDPSSFPWEIFSPKLFNGRDCAKIFLPEQQCVSRPDCATFPGMEAAVMPASTEPAMMLQLRTIVGALAKAKSFGTDAIRARLVQRYGKHIPLHRTAVVILAPVPEAGEPST